MGSCNFAIEQRTRLASHTLYFARSLVVRSSSASPASVSRKTDMDFECPKDIVTSARKIKLLPLDPLRESPCAGPAGWRRTGDQRDHSQSTSRKRDAKDES